MNQLQFEVISERSPGEKLHRLFNNSWPSYRAWYLDEGEAARPSYLECTSALQEYMPELVPIYQQLLELFDCDDLKARFLSLYCPPPFYSACSQLIYKKEQNALIRNYDFPAFLCEGKVLHSQWLGKQTIAMADCGWGALDGINEAGLSVSINYGGRLVEGEGFGITLLVRYLLETCDSVEEAIAACQRIPVHLDYNIALVDRAGNHSTVYIAPDRQPRITNELTSTNHQDPPEESKPLFLEDSAIRLDALNWLAGDGSHQLSQAVSQFLQPPLYRSHCIDQSGTLYTAVYQPEHGCVSYMWPHHTLHLSFAEVNEQVFDIHYNTTTQQQLHV